MCFLSITLSFTHNQPCVAQLLVSIRYPVKTGSGESLKEDMFILLREMGLNPPPTTHNCTAEAVSSLAYRHWREVKIITCLLWRQILFQMLTGHMSHISHHQWMGKNQIRRDFKINLVYWCKRLCFLFCFFNIVFFNEGAQKLHFWTLNCASVFIIHLWLLFST